MTSSDPGAASRELTKRISRLTWIGRIASVLAGLLVAGVVIFFLVGTVSATGGGPRRGRGGRGSATLFAVAVAAGFVLPFLGARAFFKWFLAARRTAWIAELAVTYNCDAERLRKLAEALTELA